MLTTSKDRLHLSAGIRRTALLSRDEDAVLYWTPESGGCVLSWGEGQSVRLLPETQSVPSLSALALSEEACPVPDIPSANPLARALISDSGMMTTCAFSLAKPPQLLSDGVDALNARLEALTGRPLSRAALLSGDPTLALDFSDAPDLDLIMITSLNFRADYQAAVLAQALAYHAERGTPVRIMVSASLVQGRDRDFLTDLAARYPSIQLQFYIWRQNMPGKVGAAIHRAQHTKFFLTLSKDPDTSRVIIGGRNLHDGYFFEHPFDLTAWPMLRDHVQEGLWERGYFAIFEDVDIELRDPAFVRAIASQALAYWYRDAQSMVPLGSAQVAPANAVNGSGPLMRHSISFPWSDGRGLEDWVVEMIDASRQDITIVSEFFSPPDRILDALLRAQARGVTVRIVYQIGSPEPSNWLIKPLNTLSAARWGDRFTFYAYDGPAQILHAKIMVVDGALSLMGSSNFNRRSFAHDSENVLAILDHDSAQMLLRLAERLISASNPVPPGQPVPRIGAFIESWPILHDLF
ncbi:MAG: phosphatidylserine/phosphatidylglycerophosphate/cardiolipin synthase family protein [Octadecabacter sp.]|nr:phosphatidylserine/phosphatidylglycerophosphate/cardiolipin synthase family protein [Octadecabacter sp.]